MNDMFVNINACVLEASLNVYESHVQYSNKQRFIEDVNNNVMISESMYDELTNKHDSIIMESDTSISASTITEEEIKRYRFDFLTHNFNTGIQYNRIAQKVISAYEASQLAKQNEDKDVTPLGDLLLQHRRTKEMNKFINNLYDGKARALYSLIGFISKLRLSGIKTFLKVTKITGYNTTQAKHSTDIPGNLVNIKIEFKLPKTPITKRDLAILKYIDERKALVKKMKEVKLKEGVHNEYVILNEKLRKLDEKKPSFNLSEEQLTQLSRDTCYVLDKNALVPYEVAFHCKHDKSYDPTYNEIIDRLSKLENTKEQITINAKNNRDQIIALGKQFGFIN